MEKTIKKQIVSSEIFVSEIVVEDMTPRIVQLDPLVLTKKIASLGHAETEMKKADQYKEKREEKARLIVSGFENHDDTYEMTQTEFMKYATKVGEEQTSLDLDDVPEIEIGEQA